MEDEKYQVKRQQPEFKSTNILAWIVFKANKLP